MVRSSVLAAAIATVFVAAPAAAQDMDFAKVTLATVPVARNVLMLEGGQGGNIAVCVGKDDVLLVDDQFAPLTEKIMAAVRKLSDKPVRFLVNTHWHGDHTGGNENFAKAGTTIVAHENTFRRLSTEQISALSGKATPPAPRAAWPVIAFAEEMTLHACDSTIRLRRVGPAHTDTDVMVEFVEAGVFHLGDTYFSETYPFFDVGSGGSIDGMIRANDDALRRIPARAPIIPGHGHLSNKKELRAFRDMLVTVRQRIGKAIAAGKSIAEINAMQPTKDLDATWAKGFMSAEFMTRITYASLGGKP
jgi:glyoxylase-like metal-dependent hydrolase (beta-lactamase superfamily II)